MEPAIPPAWNRLIRALRAARGYTQDAWADWLGVSRRTLQRWETGRTIPDALGEAALLRLCNEKGLLRRYDQGPLQGLDVTTDLLHDLLAAARLTAADAPQLEVPPASAPGAHLPLGLTRFFGREQELADIARLLTEAPLLTLTGVGGTGKTRLAVEAAQGLLSHYDDGVWFVDLSGVADPAGVVPVIAQVLGVVASEGRPLAASLAAFLRRKQILLVLDNFEQVVTAALEVYALLAAAPGLAILVTSRMPLRVEGEHEYAVTPLPLPAVTQDMPLETLGKNAAIQLFVERARAVRADFALTRENALVLQEICHRLDGLPLAIELAAARIKLLPPVALLARLDQRLGLLTGGARSLPARQQTLRATIAWSWDLLSELEQALFRRLSVFAGGWTLEAMEAVANVVAVGTRHASPEYSVADSRTVNDASRPVGSALPAAGLDGLASLVDQSLVRQTEVDREPRFSMLATLREFAAEQLAAMNESVAMQRRHAEYFCAFAEEAHAAWWRTGRALEHMMGPFGRERENLIGALHWALEHGDADIGLRLAGELGPWFLASAPDEGLRWLQQILRLPGADRHDRIRGIALVGGAFCAGAQRGPGSGDAYWEEAAAIFREIEDLPWLSRTLALWGADISTPEGTALTAEAIALARAVGEPYTIAHCEGLAGLAHAGNGDLAVAQKHCEKALRISRELGADWEIEWALLNLARIAQLDGRHAEARKLLLEVRCMVGALADRRVSVIACIQLAQLASTDGARGEAAAEWRNALEYARDFGSTAFPPICHAGIAGLLVACGRAEDAARLLARSARDWHGPTSYEHPSYPFRETYEPALARTRAALTVEAFARAWAEGEAWSLDQATEFALVAAAELERTMAGGADGT
ncbi:MAG: ATP-binding protein [Dehalococcoidia bacterium]